MIQVEIILDPGQRDQHCNPLQVITYIQKHFNHSLGQPRIRPRPQFSTSRGIYTILHTLVLLGIIGINITLSDEDDGGRSNDRVGKYGYRFSRSRRRKAHDDLMHTHSSFLFQSRVRPKGKRLVKVGYSARGQRSDFRSCVTRQSLNSRSLLPYIKVNRVQLPPSARSR